SRSVTRRKRCVYSSKVSPSEMSCCKVYLAASRSTNASIRCATTHASRNWSNASTREFQNEPGKLLRRAKAAQRLQGCGRLCGRWLVGHTDHGDHCPSAAS